MSELKSKSQRELRLMRNADILRRMRNGDPLNAVDSKASWFPPRPIIKKDLVEMARLYSDAPMVAKDQWSKASLKTVDASNSSDDLGPVTEAG